MSAGARPAWHRRWRHSLGARLTLLFVLFALVMSVVFMAGMQAALRYGWQDYARPLVADYIDRLAAQIGTPPDVEKARAYRAPSAENPHRGPGRQLVLAPRRDAPPPA